MASHENIALESNDGALFKNCPEYVKFKVLSIQPRFLGSFRQGLSRPPSRQTATAAKSEKNDISPVPRVLGLLFLNSFAGPEPL